MNHAQFWGGGGAAPYEIEQSLRFDGSSYLDWTPSSAGNRKTWTWSGWVKRGPVNTTEEDIFGVEWSTGDVPSNSIRISNSTNSDQKLYFTVYLGAGSDFGANGNGVARDPGAWMHLVAVWDTTNATETERMRFYINGVQQPRIYGNGITQNADGSFNTTTVHRISGGSTYGRLFQGYLAETHFVDGQALDHEDFGEFDDNGVWRPIRYTGSHGTNGFYLKFDPSATNGIGHDHSGNGNHFTASGFDTTNSTASTYDVMSDTPTTNWCTLNPLKKDSNTTLSEGNLRAAGSSSTAYNTNTQATFAQSSGKWYYEATYVSTSSTLEAIGWARTSLLPTSNPTVSGGLVYRPNYGDYLDLSGNNPTTPPTTSTSTVIQVAIDFDAGKIWFGSGGTWFNSGDPAAGSNEAMTFTGGAEELSPCVRTLAATFDFNFGQRDFSYTPPTGFKALNTSNLSAPDIADGTQHFDTVLYQAATSNGTYTHGNLDFRPDFTWIKNRDNVERHFLIDVIRGNTNITDKFLTTVNTATEGTNGISGTTFSVTDTGYQFVETSIGSGELYFNNRTYVGWNWLAGGSVSANNNTDGSITSTVSANPDAGFSIVTYTGNSTGGATVGHGLGVAPKMIIAKSRGGGTYPTASWGVYHEALGASKWLALDTTAAAAGPFSNPGTFWYNTAPTSTVFSLGNLNETNSNNNYVAYCFAEIENYSKFGSFEGDDADPGPFVYLGFKPALILLKNADASQDWVIYDTKRSAYNEAYQHLHPNTTGTENTTSNDNSLDILSNGFRPMGGTTTNDAVNGPSQTIIYAAFAEHPFGGSGVSPATAR